MVERSFGTVLIVRLALKGQSTGVLDVQADSVCLTVCESSLA